MYKILDVGALEEPTEAVVIGTLYKDMKLKPSILDEYTKASEVLAAPDECTACSGALLRTQESMQQRCDMAWHACTVWIQRGFSCHMCKPAPYRLTHPHLSKAMHKRLHHAMIVLLLHPVPKTNTSQHRFNPLCAHVGWIVRYPVSTHVDWAVLDATDMLMFDVFFRLQDRGLSAALNATSFCSDDDGLVLEDEGARMPLTGDALPVQELVTGEGGVRQEGNV